MEILTKKKFKSTALTTTLLITSCFLLSTEIDVHADELIPPSGQSQFINKQNTATTYGWEWIGDILGAIGNAAHPVGSTASNRPVKWKISTPWSSSFLSSRRNRRNP